MIAFSMEVMDLTRPNSSFTSNPSSDLQRRVAEFYIAMMDYVQPRLKKVHRLGLDILYQYNGRSNATFWNLFANAIVPSLLILIAASLAGLWLSRHDEFHIHRQVCTYGNHQHRIDSALSVLEMTRFCSEVTNLSNSGR